jgi:hydroxymethylpyrimidine pyrophosphatase-like HAD family hydrolase
LGPASGRAPRDAAPLREAIGLLDPLEIANGA